MKEKWRCSLSVLLILLGIYARASSAAPHDDAVMQADHSLIAALGSADSKSAAKLLDSDFAWTDEQGRTRDKPATLDDLPVFAAANKDDSVDSHFYGKLGFVYGTHRDVRFVRIWVKRPKGWQLFVDLDTPVASESRSSPANPGNQNSVGDCDNPCRTLPFKPITPTDKAVIAEWQKTKVDEWHPNADDWATHIADEFMIINNGSARNKADRVALAKKEQAEGIGAPGAPILSMKMYDFENTAVMISHHNPYQGGKPYYNVRMFVSRDGHWPLVWSQQTTMQSEAAVPPVQSQQ